MPEHVTGDLLQPALRNAGPIQLHTLMENALHHRHTPDGRFYIYLTESPNLPALSIADYLTAFNNTADPDAPCIIPTENTLAVMSYLAQFADSANPDLDPIRRATEESNFPAVASF